MSKVEKFARIIVKTLQTDVLKYSGVTATIPPSNDHTTLPEWSESDIYVGEFLLNSINNKLFMRMDDSTIKRVVFYEDISGTTSGYDGSYNSILINPPSGGVLKLNNYTETVINEQLTSDHTFTVELNTPFNEKVNESILIFKIGGTLPTIIQPYGIIWRNSVPTLSINTSWTIVYEQINTVGTTFEIWATACKNV